MLASHPRNRYNTLAYLGHIPRILYMNFIGGSLALARYLDDPVHTVSRS